MEEQRCLLTPHIIACEIAMVMNRERPGIVRDVDVTVGFPYDAKTDSTALQAVSKGVIVEVENFRTQDLAMDLDPFSERFVEPIVAQFLYAFDSVALQSFNAATAERN